MRLLPASDGAYALVALDTQIAGSALGSTAG